MTKHYFTCDSCIKTITDDNADGVHKCPICGGDMRWNLNIAIHGNYKHPVHSDALAIHPSQRAEHERLFPNIRLDSECRPIFDNYTRHEKYLKDCNVVKHTQKVKSKGKLIATVKH